MQVMQSMEMTPEEQYDAPTPIPMDKPTYPFGLCICLTLAEMEKLGLDPTEATVGGVFMFSAMARITSVSATDGEGGSNFRLEAQITDMGVDGESGDAAGSGTKLYDKTKY